MKQKKAMWKQYLFIYFAIVALAITVSEVKKLTPKQHIISPLAEKVYAQQIVTPTPTPSEHEQIIAYINEVFGKDAPKAFELLQDQRCHENQALNPSAVNDNTTWGGVGQDIGVFQINTYWQGVTNKAFLTDWKINIDMAYRIYVNNGYRFGVPPTGGWTCGRALGI